MACPAGTVRAILRTLQLKFYSISTQFSSSRQKFSRHAFFVLNLPPQVFRNYFVNETGQDTQEHQINGLLQAHAELLRMHTEVYVPRAKISRLSPLHFPSILHAFPAVIL
jgi:hypothetical protein